MGRSSCPVDITTYTQHFYILTYTGTCIHAYVHKYTVHARIDLYIIRITNSFQLQLVQIDYIGSECETRIVSRCILIFDKSTLTAWSRILASRCSKSRFGKISLSLSLSLTHLGGLIYIISRVNLTRTSYQIHAISLREEKR